MPNKKTKTLKPWQGCRCLAKKDIMPLLDVSTNRIIPKKD
jgi:hypothetical protein